MKRLLFGLIALLLASPLHAQQANRTQLRLVIIDQLEAGIPAATITIEREGAEPVTFMSDERGLAISPPLVPGAVVVHVEFPGFEPFEAPLTLRRGAMNETVTLRIEGFEEEVLVSDLDTAPTQGAASTTTLSQEEIDALPDDPEELEEALLALAGPGGATFMMNGFSGGRLPDRDQIRAIRIRQNNYAADNHDAGRAQIEILTRPNIRWGGNANVNLTGDELNARPPQASVETPELNRNVQFGVRGPLVAGRTGFNFNGNTRNNYSTEPIIAIDEFGNRLDDSAEETSNQVGFTIGLEHSLTANQGVFLQFQRSENENLNQGVGGFNLPERASTRTSDSNQLRFRLQGLVGASSINEFRVQVNRSGNESFSLSGAPTIRVQDAFTRGGAGVNSNSRTERYEVAENFDFTIGKHQMRVGFLVEASRFTNFDERNAAGTWTYRTVEDFRAGRPQQFTQRLGRLDTEFAHYEAGFFWSDEIRLHRDFTLGIGVRNELQSRIDDRTNLMPRLGFTWAPFGSQRSAVRGGYGLFYDWYESSLYDQTLRVDGVSVRDIRISCTALNAYCADVEALLATDAQSTPSGRVQAHPGLRMPRLHQASVSYDVQVMPNMTVQTSYQMLRGEHQMRSRNINAPVNGVRPNPAFGDITQFESTGRSESDRLNVGVQFRLPTRQMFFRVNYTLAQAKNHADGSTSLPSDSLNPDVDWGPSRQDTRHRVQINGQLPQVLGIRASLNFTAQSGSPYNMTTGRDDNDDGVFNDRPAGVTRNSLRGDATWGLNMNVSRRFSLAGLFGTTTPTNTAQGGALLQRGGGGQGFGGPGGNRGGGGRGGGSSMEIFASANNVLNHLTRTGYTGNLSSPFFGTATSVGRAREINVGLRFNF